jgi:hypothetical protein
MAQANPILNEYGFTEQELWDLEGLIDRRGIEQVLQQSAKSAARSPNTLQRIGKTRYSPSAGRR